MCTKIDMGWVTEYLRAEQASRHLERYLERDGAPWSGDAEGAHLLLHLLGQALRDAGVVLLAVLAEDAEHDELAGGIERERSSVATRLARRWIGAVPARGLPARIHACDR